MTELGKLQALNAGVELRDLIGHETVSFFVSPYKSCKQTFQYLSGSFSEHGVGYSLSLGANQTDPPFVSAGELHGRPPAAEPIHG